MGFAVTYDDAGVHLEATGAEPWRAELPWATIERVCFEGADFTSSDVVYLFVRGRPESYVVPVECVGGSRLLLELAERAVIPWEFVTSCAMGTGKVLCWPAPEGPIPTH